MNYKDQAKSYLSEARLYQLGNLTTEAQNLATVNLSRLANHDLKEAISILKKVDSDAVQCLKNAEPELQALREDIRETLLSHHKVFFCGCGATGRLSLSLETFWKKTHIEQAVADQVIGLMAGGDFALVKSVENFEDFPAFGEKHLLDLGFKDGDLLVSTSEGGETPYVIGATEAAARVSRRKPWFLFCNSKKALCETVDRSKHVIENPHVINVSLETGAMALSGSTRLQATTVLMFAVGSALLDSLERESKIASRINRFVESVKNCDFSFLIPFIERESALYNEGSHLLYETDDYGISILTDTTERSPTFSLGSFENKKDDVIKPALSYLKMRGTHTPHDAWRAILGRLPRGLDWPGYSVRLGVDSCLGFDFSENVTAFRNENLGEKKQEVFQILKREGAFHFSLGSSQADYVHGQHSILEENLILKLILNIHSLLVMGRIGRFESNIMTWVKPSNGKLVDRSARYVGHLYRNRTGKSLSYEDAVTAVFQAWENLPDGQPVVLKALQLLEG